MRDDKIIIFRAYVNGITENVKPNWNTSQFIGRSEPIYNYSHGERDINFNLKLMAGTRNELDAIYAKMNRLTSMAYPAYRKDVDLDNKVRMKPPLVKMRYGDLYNTTGITDELFTGVLGFISSITYSIPDSATYETEAGMQVPKHIEAAISFTVIHNEAPELMKDFETRTQFYGHKLPEQNKSENLGIDAPIPPNQA